MLGSETTNLEQASKALAELNAFSLIVPDIDLFIRMHIVKEANQSSRIEGTQTHMDEVLAKKESIDPEKRDDWQEVQNYIQALNEALDELEQLQLYQQPIMSIKQVSILLDLTPRAATALVNEFVKMGILFEKTGYKRNKEFVFEQYLKLF